MLFFILCVAQGLDLTKIPSTGNPPNRRFLTSTAVDSEKNRLIIFGGFDIVLESCVSSMITFDLTSNTWGEILPESMIIPLPTMGAAVHIRSDRKFLVLFGETDSGISSGVYTFDLNTNVWNIERLVGDSIMGRSQAAYTSFVFSGKNYLAVFGGITSNGTDNQLFL